MLQIDVAAMTPVNRRILARRSSKPGTRARMAAVELTDRLKANGSGDIKVVYAGVIPEQDCAELRAPGVAEPVAERRSPNARNWGSSLIPRQLYRSR